MNEETQGKPERRGCALVLLCVVVTCFMIVVLAFRPRYVDLEIPIADHLGGDAFWYETHRTVLSLDGVSGRIFIVRRRGTAYTDTHGWEATDDVVRYFERYIFDAGWTERQRADGRPEMPEGYFLADGYQEYRRKADPWGYTGSVFLAVWPIGDGIDGFHVTLVTANPSYWREFVSSLD